MILVQSGCIKVTGMSEIFLKCRTYLPVALFALLLVGCEQPPLKPLANAPDADAELIQGDDQAEDGLQRTSGQFLTMIAALDGVVIVDFWGPHCPSCRQLDPELETVARAQPNSVSVLKIDAEAPQNRELVTFFRINAIPHMLVFRDGQPVGRLKGYLSAAQILHRLKKVIKAVQVAAAE